MDDGLDKEGSGLKTVVESKAPDLGIPPEACLIEGIIEPCTIVIFGASGDLTTRKLVPALYNLYLNNGLPNPFLIVGCARRKWTRQDFQRRMEGSIKEAGDMSTSKWPAFEAFLYYHPLEYDSPQSFAKLTQFLRDLDRKHSMEGNRIFYLATPPFLYKKIAQMLGQAGLSVERVNGNGWSRIVVEKPFGRDLATAVDLNQTLYESFQEHQIYRIDHYLAKETVQNMLIFRFCNTIFEPIWNREYIDYVGIIAAETLGVEHRAGYYEQAGVLRDMFQNHMMQLLALTAMEPPSLFEADRVRDEKVKVFRSLKPLPNTNQEENLILGQYGSGRIDGKEVSAYRDESGVNPESLTPTFAIMRVFIDNWRWTGIPFYMISGKRLARKLTQIVIQFREVPHSMFQDILGEHIMANRLLLGVQPDERISLTFQTKNPGAMICIRSVTMDFNYYLNYSGPVLAAYEKVLLDCIQGDHILFWRQDGVELSWSFLTPVLEMCENCPERAEQLHPYESGGWGPEAAQAWMKLITGNG
ncbi:MAG: glucose-6-phosphate dehydrogenase [Syntrophobacterales bacterium]|nr:MAG: glucose-6-phosphate dehydrogenase [Syntrophobacterales bacterium]